MPSQFQILRKEEVNKAAANQQPAQLLSATDSSGKLIKVWEKYVFCINEYSFHSFKILFYQKMVC